MDGEFLSHSLPPTLSLSPCLFKVLTAVISLSASTHLSLSVIRSHFTPHMNKSDIFWICLECVASWYSWAAIFVGYSAHVCIWPSAFIFFSFHHCFVPNVNDMPCKQKVIMHSVRQLATKPQTQETWMSECKYLTHFQKHPILFSWYIVANQ